MDFVITRTTDSENLPCKEAKCSTATHVDRRTIESLEEARIKLGESWFSEGTNHRKEDGMVVRDMPKRKVWIVEINGLEDLIRFQYKYGELIILESGYKEYPLRIEIYDDYRE